MAQGIAFNAAHALAREAEALTDFTLRVRGAVEAVAQGNHELLGWVQSGQQFADDRAQFAGIELVFYGVSDEIVRQSHVAIPAPVMPGISHRGGVLLQDLLYLEPELIAKRSKIVGEKEILKVVGQGVGQPMEISGPTTQRALHDALRTATVETRDSLVDFLNGDQLTEIVMLGSVDKTLIDAAELSQRRARQAGALPPLLQARSTRVMG